MDPVRAQPGFPPHSSTCLACGYPGSLDNSEYLRCYMVEGSGLARVLHRLSLAHVDNRSRHLGLFASVHPDLDPGPSLQPDPSGPSGPSSAPQHSAASGYDRHPSSSQASTALLGFSSPSSSSTCLACGYPGSLDNSEYLRCYMVEGSGLAPVLHRLSLAHVDSRSRHLGLFASVRTYPSSPAA